MAKAWSYTMRLPATAAGGRQTVGGPSHIRPPGDGAEESVGTDLPAPEGVLAVGFGEGQRPDIRLSADVLAQGILYEGIDVPCEIEVPFPCTVTVLPESALPAEVCVELQTRVGAVGQSVGMRQTRTLALQAVVPIPSWCRALTWVQTAAARLELLDAAGVVQGSISATDADKIPAPLPGFARSVRLAGAADPSAWVVFLGGRK